MGDMAKKRHWFRDTSIYYWIVLVVWASFKEAIPLQEIRAKIMETLIALIAALILLFFWNVVYPIPNITGNTLLYIMVVLGVTFVIRFIAGIIYIPVKLNKEKQNQIDQLTPVEGNIEIELPNEDDCFVQGDKITIEVLNKNTNADIEKFFIRPISIFRISANPNEASDDRKLKPLEYKKNLLPIRKAFEGGTITLSAGIPESINLLEVGERSLKFLFCEDSLEKEIPSNHAYYGYAITLKISGQLNNHPVRHDLITFAVYGLLLPQLKKSDSKNIQDMFVPIDTDKEPRLQVYIRKS